MKTDETTILMADDDDEDCELMKEAFEESRLVNDLRFVGDGEELMDYLRHRGSYADPGRSPRPGLILLDLNMPRKDGREVLGEIKSDPDLRKIPVVVFTTSQAERDILKSYDLGANAFVTKPGGFRSLVEVTRSIVKYWLQTMRPSENNGLSHGPPHAGARAPIFIPPQDSSRFKRFKK